MSRTRTRALGRASGLALVVASVLTFTSALAEVMLHDIEFWRASAGWWRSDNTYLDRNLDYNIRSYHSVVHIELDGRIYRETEYKSYPPGTLAALIGRGSVAPDEGVETVTVRVGELVDDVGTVRIVPGLPDRRGEALTRIHVLSDDTGLQVTGDELTNLDSYRMFITLPVADRRYLANFGLVSGDTGPGSANAAPDAAMGDLRGFSLFRGQRIGSAEAAAWRATFRERLGVAAIVQTAPDGTVEVIRIADQ